MAPVRAPLDAGRPSLPGLVSSVYLRSASIILPASTPREIDPDGVSCDQVDVTAIRSVRLAHDRRHRGADRRRTTAPGRLRDGRRPGTVGLGLSRRAGPD